MNRAVCHSYVLQYRVFTTFFVSENYSFVSVIEWAFFLYSRFFFLHYTSCRELRPQSSTASSSPSIARCCKAAFSLSHISFFRLFFYVFLLFSYILVFSKKNRLKGLNTFRISKFVHSADAIYRRNCIKYTLQSSQKLYKAVAVPFLRLCFF